jgi:serine-type D-Ala-D-Ala carboxypeptidase/endopeptidase
MKLAQQPRSNIAQTARIGLAWMTSGKAIVWGLQKLSRFHEGWSAGVAILANTATEIFDDLGFATPDSNAPLVPTDKAIILHSASLDDYVGTYRSADKFLLIVFRLDDEPRRPESVLWPFSHRRPTSSLGFWSNANPSAAG